MSIPSEGWKAGKDDSAGAAVRPATLTDADLPPLFHAADTSSQTAQRSYLRMSAAKLTFLIAAALAGALSAYADAHGQARIAAAIAALAFVCASLVELYQIRSGLQHTWYEARAAAESVKTLSWRYAVGGAPFDVTSTPGEADDRFLRQLGEMLGVLKHLPLTPPTTSGEQITPAMRALREATYRVRRDVYAEARVGNQQKWYHAKAQWNLARSRLWVRAMLGAELLGLIVAVAAVVEPLDLDLLGLAGTVVAAMTAWTQTKQYRSLSNVYTLTGLELASVLSKVKRHDNEREWPQFMADAEEAFSREHTLWLASRSTGRV